MTNKTFIPCTFNWRKMHFGAVLMLDLNRSTNHVSNERSNYGEDYILFKELYKTEVINRQPQDCQCEVHPLVSGDCHKVTAEFPCDFIQHFRIPYEAAVDTISYKHLPSLNGIAPNVGALAMGQILELPSVRKAASRHLVDDNHGLAFSNAKDELDTLKGYNSSCWSSFNYLLISSPFPPIDLLLNVSSALWAKDDVLCLENDTVKTLQRYWTEIVQGIFSFCRNSDNWQDVDENSAIFCFDESHLLVKTFIEYREYVKHQIETLLLAHKNNEVLLLALRGLQNVVNSIFLKNIFILKNYPSSKRDDFTEPDDTLKCKMFKMQAESHGAIFFPRTQIHDARKPIMRFLGIAA